jgi:hypothetical protein
MTSADEFPTVKEFAHSASVSVPLWVNLAPERPAEWYSHSQDKADILRRASEYGRYGYRRSGAFSIGGLLVNGEVLDVRHRHMARKSWAAQGYQ